MTEQANLEEALRLACLWGGIDLDKGNTVMARGINAILAGDVDDGFAASARELAAGRALERKRGR